MRILVCANENIILYKSKLVRANENIILYKSEISSCK